MKLLRLMKIVAAAQNLGRNVKSVRHTIFDRTKADVEISAPGENLCVYQKVWRISSAPAYYLGSAESRQLLTSSKSG